MISRLLESCDSPVLCQHDCGYQGSLVEVTRHEEDCTKGMQMCSNQGCEEMVSSRDMMGHQITCPYSPVQCFVCKLSYSPLVWSTDHPACFNTLDDIRVANHGQMLLDEGRVTVFISSYQTHSSFLVFGRLEDAEDDRRVRISLSSEENGELVALLPINKWAAWYERVWARFPGWVLMDIGIE